MLKINEKIYRNKKNQNFFSPYRQRIRNLFFFVFLLFDIALYAAKIVPETYYFDAVTLKNTPVIADPGFKKLIDGKVHKSDKIGSKLVVWRYRDNKLKPVELTFKFGHDTRINAVKLYFYRPNAIRKHTINYGISSVKLFGITASGQKLPLSAIAPKQPYAKPDNMPCNDVCVMKTALPVDIVSAVLVIDGNRGRLALSEVTFSGVPGQKKLPGKDSGKDIFKALITRAPASLGISRYGEHFVMENRDAVYAVTPKFGGGVSFAYDRNSRVNLIRYPRNGVGDWGPFFTDRFWPGGNKVRDMYNSITYTNEIIYDGKDKKQFRVTGRGRGGIFYNVTIAKTYTLYADSPVLHVNFRITNELANVVPLKYGYWTCGGISHPGGYVRVWQGISRVQQYSQKPNYLMSRELSGAWYAALTPEGYGLAVSAPEALLRAVGYWNATPVSGTIESKLGIFPINAGESLNFDMALCPFSGIGTPDKISPRAAGSLQVNKKEKTGEIRLLFFRPGNYTLKLSHALVSGDKAVFQVIKTFNPVSQKRFSGKFDLPRKNGTNVLRAELFEHGKKVFTMEKAFVSGENSGTCRLSPGAAKRPALENVKTGLMLDFHSDKFVTPHIKWAKPYAGTVPRVLAVNTGGGGIRDMIEMVQRFDMKLTTNFIGGKWSLSGECMELTVGRCVNELERKLKKMYDCIMISGDAWRFFTPGVTKAVLNQVRNGTGLLIFEPGNLPRELAEKFISVPNAPRTSAPWRSTGVSKLMTGIPFAALPPVPVSKYKSSGLVLAEAGGKPLISQFQYGKGKVFACAYAIKHSAVPRKRFNFNRESYFFLPLMSTLPKLPEYKYYEYQMALLARLIYDASAEKTRVTLEKLSVLSGRLVLILNAVENLEVVLNLTCRNKFSDSLSASQKHILLSSGSNRIELPLPKTRLAGIHFADLIVKSKRGSECWGSTIFYGKSSGVIRSIELEKNIFRKDEKLQGKVTVKGSGTLKIKYCDNFGNVFARSEGPLLNITLANCKTPACRIVAELFEAGKVIDRKVARCNLYQPPNPRRFHIALGWPLLSSKGQPYLYDSYISRLHEYGIDSIVGDRYSGDIPVAEAALRDNNILYLGTHTKGHLGGKKPYNRYLKPKNKFDLVRKPCLSRSGFKEKLERDGAVLGSNLKYGVLMVAGPDESNMFSSWEGCFSPDCQRLFRDWLKKSYSSLKNLNKSWHTYYKNWNQVVAMTSAEARKHSSFAPWVDHRTFNDWNRADALKTLVRGIHKTAPGIPFSFSGTQETNPWNAWDWYRLMPYLGALSSYNGEQTIQHRSFAAGKILQFPWIGYDRPFAVIHQQLLRDLMNGATGVCIYSNTFYINPDYTLPDRGQELRKCLDFYKGGIAEAIMDSEFPASPVAFLYSPPSQKVAWIINRASLQKSSIGGMKFLLRDLALNYDYVASGKLTEDGSVPPKYKLLYLPASAALSDREAAALKKFVAEGGILIADMLAGLYDQHGTLRTSPVLNDIFGIACRGKIVEGAQLVSNGSSFAGLSVNALNLKVTLAETGITLSSAKALAFLKSNGKKSPAVLVNSYGKGFGIYFGASLPSVIGNWQEMCYFPQTKKQFSLIKKFISEICKRAAITPEVKISEIQAAKILMRQQNQMRFLAVSRNVEQSANLPMQGKALSEVALSRSYHIYDLHGKNKYLGYGKSFKYLFLRNGQYLFALLPYKPEKLQIQTSVNGKVVRLQLQLLADENISANHIFQVKLFFPSGKENTAYTQLVFGKKGFGQHEFVLPDEMSPGTWRIEARDVLTGISSCTEISKKEDL